MPAVISAIGTFLANVGLAAGYSGAVYGTSIAIGASVLVAGTAAIAYGLKELVAIDMPRRVLFRSRLVFWAWLTPTTRTFITR